MKSGVIPNIVPKRITVNIIRGISPNRKDMTVIKEKIRAAADKIIISLKILFFVLLIRNLETRVPKKIDYGNCHKYKY